MLRTPTVASAAPTTQSAPVMSTTLCRPFMNARPLPSMTAAPSCADMLLDLGHPVRMPGSESALMRVVPTRSQTT